MSGLRPEQLLLPENRDHSGYCDNSGYWNKSGNWNISRSRRRSRCLPSVWNDAPPLLLVCLVHPCPCVERNGCSGGLQRLLPDLLSSGKYNISRKTYCFPCVWKTSSRWCRFAPENFPLPGIGVFLERAASRDQAYVNTQFVESASSRRSGANVTFPEEEYFQMPLSNMLFPAWLEPLLLLVPVV